MFAASSQTPTLIVTAATTLISVLVSFITSTYVQGRRDRTTRAHERAEARRKDQRRAYEEFLYVAERVDSAVERSKLDTTTAPPSIDEVDRVRVMVELYGTDAARTLMHRWRVELADYVSSRRALNSSPPATPRRWDAVDSSSAAADGLTKLTAEIRAQMRRDINDDDG